MIVVGVWAVWTGGEVFRIMTAIVCGLMTWELAHMIAPQVSRRAIVLGASAAAALMLSSFLPPPLLLAIVLAPALLGAIVLPNNRLIFLGFAGLVMLAGYEVLAVRTTLGFFWLAWLIAVVIATDVVGYFAGRLIGGPKFWPKISPKKTWAGTVFGWLGAAAVGYLFSWGSGAAHLIIPMSIALSLASQAGDIGESAIKRHMGVKDSSALIPGHGGLLDRFDGMLGAAILMLLATVMLGFPQEML